MSANVLLSYHYFKSKDLGALIDSVGGIDVVDLFVDSGGFSALNAGAVITVAEYAEWILAHRRVINFAASLDAIGDPEQTEANYRELRERVGDAVVIVPVFHVGTDFAVLEAMVKETRLVAFGGAVGVNRRRDALIGWLAQAHGIAARAGCAVHGFGLTRPPYPTMFPWYSIDSSYWNAGQRNGRLILWDGDQFATIAIGRPTALRHARVLRNYRFEPKDFATLGYGLASTRGSEQAKKEREAMSVAAALSCKHAEQFMAQRFPALEAEGVRGVGPKVYMAIGSRSELDTIVRVSR